MIIKIRVTSKGETVEYILVQLKIYSKVYKFSQIYCISKLYFKSAIPDYLGVSLILHIHNPDKLAIYLKLSDYVSTFPCAIREAL